MTGAPATDASADSFSPTEFNSAVTAITSAFGDTTRREIYLFVRQSDAGVTAGQVAEHFDLHANVARHHLDKLAAGGYLAVEVARQGQTGAGRPSKIYKASTRDAPVEIPVRYDNVLMTLLVRALGLLPLDVATEMAEDVGREYGEMMAGSITSPSEQRQSLQTAVKAIADAMTAHGFAAHVETTDGETRVVSDHCPFGDAVLANPVICAVDRGMMRGMLSVLYGEASTKLEASRVRGDDTCITRVTV